MPAETLKPRSYYPLRGDQRDTIVYALALLAEADPERLNAIEPIVWTLQARALFAQIQADLAVAAARKTSKNL